MRFASFILLGFVAHLGLSLGLLSAEDRLRDLQESAAQQNSAPWGHWGARPQQYSAWTNHSSRLVPVYTFGITLDELRRTGSPYRDADRLTELYTRPLVLPPNPAAEYFDQTDLFKLQQQAIAAGKKHVILMIFDGMDWQTTQAAAIYKTGKVEYQAGRGRGLSFQDYSGTETDFGYFVTSPICAEPKIDVDGQVIVGACQPPTGYDWRLGGDTPWAKPARAEYLLGIDRENPGAVVDSAASATAMCAGIKTFNGSINYNLFGRGVPTLARTLQAERNWSVGVVTSVPISHATPACAYANNVSRDDYQDLSRDLLGLPSIANRRGLPGVEVLIGCGWGEDNQEDNKQGANFIPGNRYLPQDDLQQVRVENGGQYVVAERTAGKTGAEVLSAAARRAVADHKRLFGYFGVGKGHLPFRTADGGFNPAADVAKAEQYSPADVTENPTLAGMTTAALFVLENDPEGFWLMVEAGDVDWANHSNNLDNSIGAVLSGEAAFDALVKWIEQRGGWNDTALIVTADHGHFFNLVQPDVLAGSSHASKP